MTPPHWEILVIFSRWTVAYGASLGTKISVLLSFNATIALLVARLSEIPAAILDIVVPEAGHTITESILADPLADLAARLWLFSMVHSY